MVDMNMQSIGKVANVLKPNKLEATEKVPEGASFGQWLNKSIQSVSKLQDEADASARKLATGENKDIHGTMIQMQKAEITLNLMVEVRNKVISAYEEIKRMSF